MSQKRPSKRSRSAIDDTSGDYSPPMKSIPSKRSKFEEYSCETDIQDNHESFVRRSSRAPKPKVFDDEYLETSLGSPVSEREIPKKKDPKPSSRSQAERRSVDDILVIVDEQESSAKRRSSRVPKPKLFDEDYVESTKMRGSDDGSDKTTSYVTDTKTTQDRQQEISLNPKPNHKDRGKNNKPNIDLIDTVVASGSKKSLSVEQKAKRSGSSAKTVLKASPSITDTSDGSLGFHSSVEALGSPKIRTSSRTPVPKKTFALIDDSPSSKPDSFFEEEDLYVDETRQGSHKPKHGKKISIVQSDSSLTSGEEIDIIHTSPVISKKKGNAKLKEAGSAGERNKKSKKPKTGLDFSFSKDIGESTKKLDANKYKNKGGNQNKERIKKASSKPDNTIKGNVKEKDNDNENIIDKMEVPTQLKKKSKKKKDEVKEVDLQPTSFDIDKSIPILDKSNLKSPTSEHGKKSSKHSKMKHKDEPHSEVKDEDHHIILKLHLPHTEGSHHSHSSHKKRKHKHSTENKSDSDSKAKKRKLSAESTPLSSENKHKKKLSIKFKGLSSETPGVEFEGAEKEQVSKEKEKNIKAVGSMVPKKKSKKPNDKPSMASSSDEKEHLKVVIKKAKKEVNVITDLEEGENPAKKVVNKDVKEKTKDIKEVKTNPSESVKTTPKKKGKGESPKSTEKEKRKIVSGYLLFCKKERSRIYEANPGLEFAQISQKVGEAWNNLPETTKQEWKDKANDIKKNFQIQQEEKKLETTKCVGPDVVDMAAHLKLLGESLSVIGVSLMAKREAEVHGSLSVLLDSILCAICPLTFLTSHIPGIPGISKEKQAQILDDLAYTMPGLG